MPYDDADPERMNPEEERELERARTSSRALAWMRPNSFSTVIRYKPASWKINHKTINRCKNIVYFWNRITSGTMFRISIMRLSLCSSKWMWSSRLSLLKATLSLSQVTFGRGLPPIAHWNRTVSPTWNQITPELNNSSLMVTLMQKKTKKPRQFCCEEANRISVELCVLLVATPLAVLPLFLLQMNHMKLAD